jgi:hypothetical protein
MADEVTRKSVTAEDGNQGMVRRIFLFGGTRSPAMTPLPAYWSPRRDVVLRQAMKESGKWASAVNIAITRVASLGYKVNGDIPLRVRQSREMLGRSWGELITKLALDYVTTDNGAFLEIVRASKSPGSKVLGFVHLPSHRCIRTGDNDVPLIYLDRAGIEHELKDHQVAMFSDMPDHNFYDVGLCATSRAYDKIAELQSVRRYVNEKISGTRPLAVHIVSGISQKAVDDALMDAQLDAESKGRTNYMGASILANPNDVPISLQTIPFSELPDGFDSKSETEMAEIEFATALGIDPVDLNPGLIGNRQLGAGSQAQVLNDKAASKGLILFRQQLAAFFNDVDRWHPLPGSTTFSWEEDDLRDEASKAANAKVRTDLATARIAAGLTTAKQEASLLVDAGDIPSEFVATDETVNESMTDQDKSNAAMGDATSTVAATQTPPPVEAAPAQPAPATPAPAVKEYEPTLDDLAADLIATKAVELGTITIPKRRGRMSAAESDFLAVAANELAEIGRLFVIAANDEMPQVTGETARSLRWAVEDKGTRDVALRFYVGNADRPEVAIRAVLYGRRGFGPKRAKVLAFRVGGATVFARRVSGVKANDWLQRTWDKIKPAIDAMQARLDVQLNIASIDVTDIPGAIRRTTNAQIKPPPLKKGKGK